MNRLDAELSTFSGFEDWIIVFEYFGSYEIFYGGDTNSIQVIRLSFPVFCSVKTRSSPGFKS